MEQKAAVRAVRVESLQAELESPRLLLEDTRRDRNHLQAELRKAEEANRQLEQRSPQEALEQLRSLEEQRRKLEQELAARPSEQEKQRLRQLDAEHEQRELELARLRRENSELKARMVESLKRQKEAAETYNKALGSALEEYERKVGELIQRAKSQPAFPRCANMDENLGLQREVEVEGRVPRLDEFCKDLRHRLAYNPQTKQELYYSERDVRAFVAGLAMSRCTCSRASAARARRAFHGSSPALSGATSRSSRCKRVGATETICLATSTPSRDAITRATSSRCCTGPRRPLSGTGSV
ncbi:MAG: hypothetical protein ACJ8AT_14960 [Hyalangium sp.]|uniref:hypothetical protein n=1 Tax=Hyalangium sp. TaxID=2028555 RepID=UPI00389B2B4E